MRNKVDKFRDNIISLDGVITSQIVRDDVKLDDLRSVKIDKLAKLWDNLISLDRVMM